MEQNLNYCGSGPDVDVSLLCGLDLVHLLGISDCDEGDEG